MASVPTAVVVLVLSATFWAPEISAAPRCWSYQDHAAQYHLDHQAPKYPWDEVESMMKQNPYLSEVLAKGTVVATSRPPGQQHDYSAVSVVCRSDRFMLKAFTVDNKQCYVIKPQVQQVRYTRCSEKHDRSCHYCNYNKGGVSKCEEDYEWQTVWAYCKTTPHPHPYHQPHYNPYPSKTPTLGGFPVAEPQPYHKRKVYYPAKLYAKRTYNPYKRWKRGFHGKLEKISLYLPYQCSCKSFKC